MMLSISKRVQNQDKAGTLIVNCNRKIVGFTPNLLRIGNLLEVTALCVTKRYSNSSEQNNF
jgi:hypothetical protein